MNLLAGLLDASGPLLERDLLPAWLPARRWFRSKGRAPVSVSVEARAPLGADADAPLFTVLRVAFPDGTFERYALPLVLAGAADAVGWPEHAVLGSLPGAPAGKWLCDACWDPRFREALLELLEGRRTLPLGDGTLKGTPLASVQALPPNAASRVLSAEQSNTAFAYAGAGTDGIDGLFAKLYRRLDAGSHPEPEMLRFLRECTDYRHVPPFRSALVWERGGESLTAALLQGWVAVEENAWEHALRALASPPEAEAFAALLGRRVGALHNALGSRSDLPAFAPEPFTAEDAEAVHAGVSIMLRALAPLLEKLAGEDAEAGRLATELLRRQGELLGGAGMNPGGWGRKMRTHGDLHLGQILVSRSGTGWECWITDFEGEPGRSLAEARRKRSPLRDAAGMLRSFDYLVHAAARAAGTPADAGLAARLGENFLRAYFPVLSADGADTRGDTAFLLRLFTVEKAVYELQYELNNRPDWVEIPLRGLVTLCNTRLKNNA